MAKGDKQSPIEINSKDVRHDPSLSSWHASYDPGAAKTILNNGRTCRVVFDDTFDRSGRFGILGVVRDRGLQSTRYQKASFGIQQRKVTGECKKGAPGVYSGGSEVGQKGC